MTVPPRTTIPGPSRPPARPSTPPTSASADLNSSKLTRSPPTASTTAMLCSSANPLPSAEMPSRPQSFTGTSSPPTSKWRTHRTCPPNLYACKSEESNHGKLRIRHQNGQALRLLRRDGLREGSQAAARPARQGAVPARALPFRETDAEDFRRQAVQLGGRDEAAKGRWPI